MKKTVTLIFAAFLFIFGGCGLSDIMGKSVSYLGKPSFQYNDSSNDYSLFFALADSDKNEMRADADVDIRIVNDNGETVYSGSKSVTTDDFGVYSSKAAGEALLANVRIKGEEIAEGTSDGGTVYFTVHKEGKFEFEEMSCSAIRCLPIKDVDVVCEQLPVEINVKDYGGGVQSKLVVNSIDYEFDKKINWLTVNVYGEKTYYQKQNDFRGSFDQFTYKIYDESGYLIDSGTIFLSDLAEGDKFKDSFSVSNAKPGEHYTVKFAEYN